MADFIGGVQGSGKSYYAMYYIHDNFSNYTTVLTNIDNVNSSYAKFLDMNLFRKKIEKLHTMAMVENATDEELNEFAKLENSLIVIDEAHNYFNKKDAVWNWLITYHRHLHIDLFLISQNILLIHSDHRIFNNFYIAYSPSKQFNPYRFRYAQYIGHPFKESNFVTDIKLPKSEDVFSIYQSGGAVKKTKVMGKFFALAVIVFTALAVFLYFLFDHYSAKENLEDTPEISPSKVITVHPVSKVLPQYPLNPLFTHVVVIGETFSIHGTRIQNYDILDLEDVLEVLQAKIKRVIKSSFRTTYTIILNKDTLQLFLPLEDIESKEEELDTSDMKSTLF